jgi:hypothetical protein
MDEQQPKQYSYKIAPMGWVLISLIILAVIGSILFFMSRRSGGLNRNQSEWQAIFLDNGQTYFGQVNTENDDSVIIKNVYYLVGMTNPQQVAEADKNKDFALIKLGSEVHGPFDEMRINREHILFVEDLRGDSKIVKAIDDYQKTKK